jgi:uncharacterized protein (TIGR00369 family)
VELNDPDTPTGGLRLVVARDNVNAVEALHGGAISTVLDVAAYLALLPELTDDEEAVTHALFVWYLRPARIGETLRTSAEVVRRGRALAFVRAALSAGENAYATAEVTKSIVHEAARSRAVARPG